MFEEILRESGYSEKAIEYYQNKVNVGKMYNPTITHFYTGPCGDKIKISLKIQNEVIIDAKFQAIGCAGAFSSASALTEMVKGIKIEEAEQITDRDILFHLEDMPASKSDCITLVRTAFKESVEKYKNEVRITKQEK